MIVLAGLSAYYLRSLPMFEGYVSRVFNISFQNYLEFTLFVAPFFLLIMAFEGLYTMRATRTFTKEAYGVARAVSLGLVVLVIAVFLNREWFSSRFVILVGWALTVAYIVVARYAIQRVQKWYLVNKGIGMHRVLLIGTNQKMYTLRKLLMNNKKLGYRVVDEIDTASVTRVKEIRAQKGVDEIIVGDPTLTDDEQDNTLIHAHCIHFIPGF